MHTRDGEKKMSAEANVKPDSLNADHKAENALFFFYRFCYLSNFFLPFGRWFHIERKALNLATVE